MLGLSRSALCPLPSALCPLPFALSGIRGLRDRPHLDAADAGAGNARRRLNGVVQILGLDHVETAEPLLGLGEGAVRRRHLAVAATDRRGRRDVLQTVSGEPVPAVLDALGE